VTTSGSVRSPRERRRADRVCAAVALFVPLGIIGYIDHATGASLLGVALFAVLALKLLIARRVRRIESPYPALTRSMRLSIVMPMHNEDPNFAVAAVLSMLNQSRSPNRIHVIDDGSTDDGAAATAVWDALHQHAHDVESMVTRITENVGKRTALALGLHEDTDADIFLCVDSDTVLDPEAIAAGLRPFCDERTTGVAGFVSAQNWSRNILTRSIDLRYVSAFLARTSRLLVFRCGAVLLRFTRVVPSRRRPRESRRLRRPTLPGPGRDIR
jgi:hyaluronan synthase